MDFPSASGTTRRYEGEAVGERGEAVRLARIRYRSGASDLLTVLALQALQIESQSNVIKLANAQLANRIDLHLALGGGFDARPAAASMDESAAVVVPGAVYDRRTLEGGAG